MKFIANTLLTPKAAQCLQTKTPLFFDAINFIDDACAEHGQIA